MVSIIGHSGSVPWDLRHGFPLPTAAVTKSGITGVGEGGALPRDGLGWALCWSSHFGKQHGGFSENSTSGYHWSGSSTLSYPPKSSKDIRSLEDLLPGALSIITQTWKQQKCSPTWKWMSKSWNVHAMDIGIYSVIKTNKPRYDRREP